MHTLYLRARHVARADRHHLQQGQGDMLAKQHSAAEQQAWRAAVAVVKRFREATARRAQLR